MRKENKFATGLLVEQKSMEEQESLKIEHGIQSREIIVVEKSNSFKFVMRMLIALFKNVGIVILLLLAVLGLVSVVFPETREALLVLYERFTTEISQLF